MRNFDPMRLIVVVPMRLLLLLLLLLHAVDDVRDAHDCYQLFGGT
jgi:hypothetical protein